MQDFDNLFDYTFQEGGKLKLLNINIIQSKYGISIDQTDHIMKIYIKEYWGTKKKYEVKFQQSPFPVDTWIPQNNIPSLISNMPCNISWNIYINLSYTQ